MRYNGNELKQMALSSKKTCTKEGVLSLREKEGKLWNKTDVLTERWCRLVDNMFFYFKTKDVSSDPHGVFILEGSRVRLAENDATNGCGFVLEFDGDNRSTYFLASKPSEAKDWIYALENASYTKLKQKYELLQNQQKELKGDSSPSSSVPTFADSRSANSSPLLLTRKKISPKDYNMTLSDVENSSENKPSKKATKFLRNRNRILPPDSLLPVLELTLSCVNLNISKVIEHKRSLQIRILTSFPPLPNWTPAAHSECVRAGASVRFHCTLSFFHHDLITPQTLLRFHLCQVKENSTVDSLGFASCSVSDLLYLDSSIHFNIERDNNVIGKLEIEVCREHISAQIAKSSKEDKLTAALLAADNTYAEGLKRKLDQKYGEVSQVLSLKSLYCEAISRTYRFPTTSGNYLSIQEIMLETRLSFHIPLLYLKLLIDQETKQIGTLNSITYLAKHLQELRKKQIEERQALIESYQNNVKSIVTQSKAASCFKPSVQKADKDYEFVPTNLHLQRMRVQHSDFISSLSVDSTSVESTESSHLLMAVYDIVTVGAASAHCLKYKQGGLLSLLSSSDKAKKGKEHVLSSLMRGQDTSSAMMNLSAQIQETQIQTNSLIQTLRTLVEAGKECSTVPNRSSAESAISQLSDKTCLLVSLLDNKDLCKSVLRMSSVNVQSSTAGSSIINAATGLVSGMGMEWEEQKSSVKTTLASLVKRFHLMLDSVNPLVDLENEQSSTQTSSYDEVLEDIHQLSLHIRKVIDIAMQGHAMYVMLQVQEDTAITYRRDVVFSQALSTCVCGVSTNLCSLLSSKENLEKIAKHGMLVQFESLLSTHGNEMGMLEDYIIGVLDLQKVTFCCERAGQQEGESLSHLLPTLHGTRNSLTVRLHLDPTCFDRLPDSLKRGDAIKIIPVMFNVGINEEQTLAEKFGKTSLQEYINLDSFSRLSEYVENLKRSVDTQTMTTIEDRLQSLRTCVYAKRNKNVEILHLASETCILLNGVRVTSCKSAKDRTAMAVTLEQVQNLVRSHELSLSMFSSALACMRSEGTRRENTKKNVGVRKYAFTSMQLMTFPKQYRPPDGTYGKADT